MDSSKPNVIKYHKVYVDSMGDGKVLVAGGAVGWYSKLQTDQTYGETHLNHKAQYQ